MTEFHSLPHNSEALYSSCRFQVACQDYESDTLILTFSERKEPKPADFFAVNFCNKEKISWIAVRSLENDWYLSAERGQVLDAIRDGLRQIKHRRLIMFGYSMGSFGVLMFANSLSPERIILGGPIVSLDERVERRWLSDYRDFLPYYAAHAESILPLKSTSDVIAIFDPKSEDAAHVSILEQSVNVTRIEVSGAGHLVLTYLRNSGSLGAVMRALLKPSVDTSDIMRIIHAARKRNSSYLLSLSERLARRPAMQRRILRYAACAIPDSLDVKFALAADYAKSNDLHTSASIINNAVKEHGTICFGVPLGKALVAFASAKGKINDVALAAQLFMSNRPRSRELQLWYSRFLRKSGDFDAAFFAHESFMTGDTFEAHAHIERGLIFEEHGLNYSARECFAKAKLLAPNFIPAQQHLSRIEKLLKMAK